MKTLSYRIIFALCIGTTWVTLALARYGGPGYLMNVAATGAPGEVSCTACHTGPTSAGSLQLDIVQGPNVYTPGATYQLRASLTAQGSLTGGIQLLALHKDTSMGNWIPPTNMRSVHLSTFNNPTRQYLEHSNPKAANSQGVTTWNFEWTAPLTQGILPVFYASSVATNDDYTPGGDRVYQTFLSFASLPVTWGEFALKEARGGVSISWETEEEVNNDMFQVQRSLDGHIFNTLTHVPSAGNASSTTQYSWKDSNPIYGQEIFYRIKQVDINGLFSFSEIKQLTLDGADYGLINCYPNLVKRGDLIHFTYTSQKNTTLEVLAQSMDGRSVTVDQLALDAGTSIRTINTQALQTGRYSFIFKLEDIVEMRTVYVY